MKFILFTDLHFGVKNNSMTWFRSQYDFIDKQLIPFIKDLDEDVITICLGDVFDSRSSVNTYIAQEVKDLFIKLSEITKTYIIQGNHDGYSPNDRKYNTLNLVFGNSIPNLRIISETEILKLSDDKQAVLIPWFDQEESTPEELSRLYKGAYIFTHADIIMGNPKLHTPVFSGHVHTPYINGNVRNLGSCYPLDFHDANSNRYFYVWDSETDNLKRIINEHSIRFWRAHNDEIILKDWDKCGPNDYIECYILYSLFQDPEYRNKCKQLQSQFKNCKIIPLPDELSDNVECADVDILDIIEHSIPDDLKDVFNQIKEKSNVTESNT